MNLNTLAAEVADELNEDVATTKHRLRIVREKVAAEVAKLDGLSELQRAVRIVDAMDRICAL